MVTDDRATALSLNAMVGDSLIVLVDMGLGRAADVSLPLALGLGGMGCLAAMGIWGAMRAGSPPRNFFFPDN